jgi:hypothetical protein
VDKDNPNQEQWHIVPNVVWQHLDLVHISQTVGDLFHDLIRKLVNEAFKELPQWARDIIDAILGGIEDFIRRVLAIPDDIIDWLSNFLRVSITLFDLIIQLLVNLFKNDLVLYAVNTPYKIMDEVPATKPMPKLPAVYVPITAFLPRVDAGEIVMEISF